MYFPNLFEGHVLSEEAYAALGNVHIGLFAAAIAAPEAWQPGLEPSYALPASDQVLPDGWKLCISVDVLEALFVSQLILLLFHV